MVDMHVFVPNVWGHALYFSPENGGQEGSMHGHGKGLKVDDYVILPIRNARGTTRYRVTEIRYMSDPPDQFFGRLVFDPRPPDNESLAVLHKEA